MKFEDTEHTAVGRAAWSLTPRGCIEVGHTPIGRQRAREGRGARDPPLVIRAPARRMIRGGLVRAYLVS